MTKTQIKQEAPAQCPATGLPMTVRTPLGVFCEGDEFTCRCLVETQSVRDLLGSFGLLAPADGDGFPVIQGSNQHG